MPINYTKCIKHKVYRSEHRTGQFQTISFRQQLSTLLAKMVQSTQVVETIDNRVFQPLDIYRDHIQISTFMGGSRQVFAKSFELQKNLPEQLKSC